MTEQQADQVRIDGELKKLGDHLDQVTRVVLEHAHALDLRQELHTGLSGVAEELEEAIARVNAGEEAQKLREQARQVAHNTSIEIRQELGNALYTLNEQLHDLLVQLQQSTAHAHLTRSADVVQGDAAMHDSPKSPDILCQ